VGVVPTRHDKRHLGYSSPVVDYAERGLVGDDGGEERIHRLDHVKHRLDVKREPSLYPDGELGPTKTCINLLHNALRRQ
jgi:hypothetical protein